jgi:hypothetical protein
MNTTTAGEAPVDQGVGRLMPERDRWQWLLEWMRCHGAADVLNADLVWAYVEATGAKHQLLMVGAPRCRQLVADLGSMSRLGYAKRRTTGVGDGLSGQGFPRWVWSYRPGPHEDLLTPNANDQRRA